MSSQRWERSLLEPPQAKKGIGALKDKVAVVEGIYMETRVESMDSPDVEEPFRHFFIRNPCVGIIIQRMPGAVGHIEEKEGVAAMSKMREVESSDFIDPVAVRQTESVSSIEAVFPGANIVAEGEESAKATYRRELFNKLKECKIFDSCETLLQTYEYLFRLKNRERDNNLPMSPIEDCNEKMTYGYGEYSCPYTGKPLFSTDVWICLHKQWQHWRSYGSSIF